MLESVEERIIKNIKKELVSYKKYCIKEDEVYSPYLEEAIDLCDKILTFDYFKEWKSLAGGITLDLDLWEDQYNEDRKVKEKDLNKLFKIITKNVEDWC